MKSKSINTGILASSMLTVLFAPHVSAQLTWDANAAGAARTDGAGAWLGTNQWWDGGSNVDWSPTSNAIFGNGGAGGNVTLASPTTVGSLTFNSFTGTYNLGTAGQAITLNSGITKNAGSGIAQIASPLILGGAQSWTNNSGTLDLRGPLNLNGNALTFAGSGTTTFGLASTGAISGAGGLTKTGSGFLALGAGQLTPTAETPTSTVASQCSAITTAPTATST